MLLGLFEILRASRPAADKGKYSLTSTQALKRKAIDYTCFSNKKESLSSKALSALRD